MSCLAAVLPVAGKESGPWRDRYLQVGDIKIHYLEAGAGDRTLVFVPGWMTSAEIWKEQIPYFSSRGFRVIAIDPRSQGETTRTELGNTYQQHAADLHAFLQSLKIEHCYLVGWAAGVTTLLEYLSSPEALKPEKVVFAEGGPAMVEAGGFSRIVTPQQARKLLLSFQEDRTKTMDQYLRGLFKTRQPEILYKELLESSQRTPIGSCSLSLFRSFYGRQKIRFKARGCSQPYRDDVRKPGKWRIYESPDLPMQSGSHRRCGRCVHPRQTAGI